MFNETLKGSVFVIVIVSGGDGSGMFGSPVSEGQGGEIGGKRGEEVRGGDKRGWGISGGREQKLGRKER